VYPLVLCACVYVAGGLRLYSSDCVFVCVCMCLCVCVFLGVCVRVSVWFVCGLCGKL